MALRLDSLNGGALMNMGALRAQDGRYAKALALAYQAEEQCRTGRTLEPMVLLQEALAVMPGDVEARRRLYALKAGRGAAALAALDAR